MKAKPMVGTLFKMLLVFAASVTAGAQRPATEAPSLPQRGSQEYWLMVDEFADRAVHFAYAKRFVQLHEGSVTDRQCQQYSIIAIHYWDELASIKQTGVSAQSEFWNDVRAYASRMIGAPGVAIPFHRTSKYWLTMGSQTEDRELRRVVSLEIDGATSQFIQTAGSSPSVLTGQCRTADQEPAAKAQR